MAYYVTTALGREVPLEDWQSLNSDTILKVLYDYARSLFNPQNAPLDVTSLENATGLGRDDVLELCDRLRDAGLVSRDGHRFKITPRGAELVRSMRGRISW